MYIKKKKIHTGPIKTRFADKKKNYVVRIGNYLNLHYNTINK